MKNNCCNISPRIRKLIVVIVILVAGRNKEMYCKVLERYKDLLKRIEIFRESGR